MPPVYLLKLNRSAVPSMPQESYYAQGMSAQCISLENIIHWSILKVEFPFGNTKIQSLNKPFVRFQRKWRAYFRLLRRVRNIRNLFARELLGALGALGPL